MRLILGVIVLTGAVSVPLDPTGAGDFPSNPHSRYRQSREIADAEIGYEIPHFLQALGMAGNREDLLRTMQSSGFFSSPSYRVQLQIPNNDLRQARFTGGYEIGEEALPAANQALQQQVALQLSLFDLVAQGVPEAQRALQMFQDQSRDALRAYEWGPDWQALAAQYGMPEWSDARRGWILPWVEAENARLASMGSGQ